MDDPFTLVGAGLLAGALAWAFAPKHAALVVLAMLLPIAGAILAAVWC